MEWVAALSTTALLAAALWLLRNVITTRLTNAVRHEYEKDLENLRTSVRKNEETFKAELKEKEAQIESLRSGALAAIMTRRTTLYSRQLQAVEDLWGAITSLSYSKGIAATIAVLNFDEAAREAEKNPRFRAIFENMGSNVDNDFGYKEATKSRPFVTDLAWAYYSAYQAIIAHDILRLKSLQFGVGNDYADHKTILNIVRASLPEYSEFIDKRGVSCLYYLLDAIETKLLKEIHVMLKDRSSDEEDIKRAAQILEETEKLAMQNEKIKQA